MVKGVRELSPAMETMSLAANLRILNLGRCWTYVRRRRRQHNLFNTGTHFQQQPYYQTSNL